MQLNKKTQQKWAKDLNGHFFQADIDIYLFFSGVFSHEGYPNLSHRLPALFSWAFYITYLILSNAYLLILLSVSLPTTLKRNNHELVF